MSEETQAVPVPTQEERLAALENQSFIMYLQLNAVTKILIDKGVLDKEVLTQEMDELNKQLYDITMELMDKDKAAAAETVTAE